MPKVVFVKTLDGRTLDITLAKAAATYYHNPVYLNFDDINDRKMIVHWPKTTPYII